MYNFKEVNLDPDFAKDKLKDFKTLIDRSISFVTLAMPGVGSSYFLKYLATQNFAHFIHVDLYSLPNLSLHEFYKLLLEELGGKSASKTDEQLFLESKDILRKLSQNRDKIVIIFNRFDQLKKEFDWNFLSNLQSLTTIIPDRIVLIFTAVKPLYELSPDALSGGNLNFYSENLYFKPYSIPDLKKILSIDPGRLTTKENLERLLALCGGHNQLLHIFLSSQKEQLLLDQFVKMQLKELVDYLGYTQRKQIQKISLGKKLEEVDEYLLGVGMVTQRIILSETSTVNSVEPRSESKDLSSYRLFTPLLEEYIKSYFTPKLPQKEARLFKLLRQNIDRTVSKDELFSAVWGENAEASDWALDALIYRLRKHPFIKAHGYIIESHKKVGYTLIQT